MDINTPYGLSEVRIPAPGYALIEDIKHLDGRISFLDEWAKDIAAHMKNTPRAYDGTEVKGPDGPRRLRIVHRAAATRRWFDYPSFKKATGWQEFDAVVRTIPPKHKRALRIGAPLPGKRSREWDALAKVGRAAEAAEYPQAHSWRSASIEQLSTGLFDLRRTQKTYEEQKGELRDRLIDMADTWEWEDMLWGKDDGRMILTPAKPRYEPAGDREALLRRYPQFVKTSRQGEVVAVGFYPPGKEDEEDGWF